jgi:hypothetical protein
MKTKITTVLTILLMVYCCMSCHKKIPEQLTGIWQQTDDKSVKLKLEQSGKDALAYISMQEDNWFGPLAVEVFKNGNLMITVADVTVNDNNQATVTKVPSYTKDRQPYLTADGRWRIFNNRIAVGSYKGILRQERFTVIPGTDTLVTEGLWSEVKVTDWDDWGNPKVEEPSPISTTFVRSQVQDVK